MTVSPVTSPLTCTVFQSSVTFTRVGTFPARQYQEAFDETRRSTITSHDAMAAGRMCCAECFQDRQLRREIADLSAGHARCDYCGTPDVDVVEPIKLQTYFEVLLSIYEPR
jgi:hypothetical protein